jgi:intraflagellar transport protein 74
MNLALESSSTGATRQQLQNQTLVFREKNELMQSQLEQIFKERQNKEMQSGQLETAIANEKAKMNEMIYALSADEQNRYREHQLMCERLKTENGEIHARIEAAIKQKEKLSSAVINSQARLEAVKLHSKLREITAKRNQLKDEETNRLTPAQEREKLINEVRLNNQAISSMGKQMKIAGEQLAERREHLSQVEQDLDEGSSDRHTKYKELKKRDEMMTSFMETFQAQMTQERQSKSRQLFAE